MMSLPKRCTLGYGPGRHTELWGESSKARLVRWRQLRDQYGARCREPRHPVVYDLNNDSYRAPEWQDCDWERSVLFFGCSEIFGVAANIDETVPYLYTDITGIPSVNLGIPGGSNGQIAELCEAVLNMIGVEPAAIVVAWAPLERLHIRYHDHHYTVGPWNVDNPEQFDTDATIGAWRYCRDQYRQRVMSDECLQEEFGAWRSYLTSAVPETVPLVEYSGIEPATCQLTGQTWWDKMQVPDDLARDGWHSNGRRNRRIVNQLLQEYQFLPGSRR